MQDVESDVMQLLKTELIVTHESFHVALKHICHVVHFFVDERFCLGIVS